MNKAMVDRIPFAKILVGFAVLLLISFGLCGADAVYEMRMAEAGNTAMQHMFANMGLFGLVGILVSVLGLVLTVFIWVILLIVKSARSPEV